MELHLERCTVRSWRSEDAAAIVPLANDRRVWLNLRDGFPHPYTLGTAKAFVDAAVAMRPETRWAIEVEGGAAGSIGITLHTDVERLSAELGYWLGAPYWGRGIMTEAVKAVTRHAIRAHALTRVYAVPYEWNGASCRVLEKAGFVREGRLRRAVIKDGRVIDQLMYAFVVDVAGSIDEPSQRGTQEARS